MKRRPSLVRLKTPSSSESWMVKEKLSLAAETVGDVAAPMTTRSRRWGWIIKIIDGGESGFLESGEG